MSGWNKYIQGATKKKKQQTKNAREKDEKALEKKGASDAHRDQVDMNLKKHHQEMEDKRRNLENKNKQRMVQINNNDDRRMLYSLK